MKILVSTTLSLLFSVALFAADISYELSIPAPETHEVNVVMTIDAVSADEVLVKIPVWTPGSYLVREFAKNIGPLKVTNARGTELKVQKTKKNAWKITTAGSKQLNIAYSVYCYELSVRTSYIDKVMAYINPSSVFIYVDDRQKEAHSFSFKDVQRWKNTTAALPIENGEFVASDYDLLVDTPILVSNHEKYSFKDAGKTYHLAIEGDGNYNVEQMKADLTKVVSTTSKVVDRGRPYDDYTFIVLNTDNSYGGLEHLYSTSLIYPRTRYAKPDQYFGFLSLACHEYFHLWNVKRIRPIELGPFNYDEENYTRQLWVAEGITSYYDEYLMLRAEFINAEEYLAKLSRGIANTENTPGNTQQSLADASYDAWIKFYRRDEISSTCCISYYTKGAVVSAMLDLEIRQSTKNKQNLDNVMQYLWDTYYVGEDRGFSEEEMIQAVSTITGKDMQWFFDDYIYDVTPMDYDKFLGYAGLKLNRNKAEKPYLGLGTSVEDGATVVSSVRPLSSAQQAGVLKGDEIIAIGDYRVSGNLGEIMSNFKIGDQTAFTISRDGKIMQLDATLGSNPNIRYAISKLDNVSRQQKEIYQDWIGKSF